MNKLLFLLLLIFPFSLFAQTKAEIELRTRIENTNKEVTNTRKEVDSLIREINMLDKHIERTNQLVDKSTSQIANIHIGNCFWEISGSIKEVKFISYKFS